MNQKISILATFLLCGIAGAVLAFSPLTRSSGQSFAEQTIALNEELQAIEQAKVARIRELIEFGMETETAGFHIVQPPRSADADSSDLFGLNYEKVNWYPVTAVYPETTASPEGHTAASIFAGTERLFPNFGATLTSIQTANGWGINATFTARGLAILEQVHGTVQSSDYFTDWYGETHPSGGSSATMNAAIVTSGRSLLPFDVTALIGTTAPQTVLVARDLTQADVSLIIEQYAGS